VKIAGAFLIALLVGLAVATGVSQGLAQSRPGWIAANTRCRAAAKAEYSVTESGAHRRNRAASYRACMRTAGFRP
jgi:hypothetical protein